MINRPHWVGRINATWKKTSIVWLSGVRRTGKTTLCQSFESALVLNCDRPKDLELLSKPDDFYSNVKHPIVVFDEIHQHPNPSQLLKIAADHYPKLKIIATGSSTITATKKFRDSLTGRKRTIHLPPILFEELPAFGVSDLTSRLHKGGLPPALLSEKYDFEFYSEWIDSFFARDIQELFRIDRRTGFIHLLQLLLRQSGGLLEIQSLSKLSGLSRPSVMNYIDVLEITHAMTRIRPYFSGGRQEIVKQPKLYGFDTGFVNFVRSHGDYSPGDFGLLWEHIVLETLQSISLPTEIFYWRDKHQHEIDFVIPFGKQGCDIIECKRSTESLDVTAMKIFRSNYKEGKNYLVVPFPHEQTEKIISDIPIVVLTPTQLKVELLKRAVLT